MSSNTTQPLQRKTINRHAMAIYHPLAMLAGMQLDVFSPLKDGPRSAEEIAGAIGVDAAKLAPLLYALVVAELLTVRGAVFANTAEADHYLVRGRPSYIGGAHELFSDIWQATLKTAESIRTGEPQAKHDFAAMSGAELEAFYRGTYAGALATGRELLANHDLASHRHMVDVGGGSGGLAIAACQECPHLRATIVELPSVAPITRKFVDEADLSDRIDVVTGDVLERPLEGQFDVAVLRSLLQVLAEEEAADVVRNVSPAIVPNGTLYVIGRILDDTRLTPPESVSFNLVFLNLYDHGQAYTERQYRDWLAEAGFTDIEHRRWEDAISVLRARRETSPAQ
ncbi:MAG: methyltransferase [Alphaproteobacteria bacterium]